MSHAQSAAPICEHSAKANGGAKIEESQQKMLEVLDFLQSSYPDFLRKMNFQNAVVGCIDFSPHSSCKKVTLILNESDLQSAHRQQFERFWSVFYKDRSVSLKTVILALRPKYTETGPVFDGINRFLMYFHDNITAVSPIKALQVYIDTDSETHAGGRNILLDSPYLVLDTLSPSQVRATERPAILACLSY